MVLGGGGASMKLVLREARVVKFAAVNINIYGIPLEKFRIMWMVLFWIASNCSVCPLVRA